MKQTKLRIFFERKTRQTGERFWTLTDDAPPWLQDAIREAHFGDLPTDWVYDKCQSIAGGWDDGVLSDDDEFHQFVDDEVDVYTRDRFAWAEAMCLRNLYAEAEARAKDMGSLTGHIEAQLGTIQYCAIELIAHVMLEAIRVNVEEKEDSEAVWTELIEFRIRRAKGGE